MAKNRVDADRPPKRDKFFKKSTQKQSKPKFQHKNTSEQSKVASSVESSNFFIKSSHPGTSKNPNNSKINDFQEKEEAKKEKKPFDKKKYRLQKYSNKYQLQQWEDKRKKSFLRGYYKTLKEDQPKLDNTSHGDHNKVDDIGDKDPDSNKNETDLKDVQPKNSKDKRSKPFRKAHQEFQRIKEEKEKEKEDLLKKKKEKQEAVQAYKKNKIEKFKKLNRRTKKGQPIMKDRMEMLLEKIQSSMKHE